MKFSLNKSLQILENTPAAISALLNNLSDEWAITNEGVNTWSAKEVVAHLILCEKTNWLPRIKIILSYNQPKSFITIDMSAHFDIAKSNSLQELITEFNHLREKSIQEIQAFELQEPDFLKTAVHPVIGEVTLQQLISAWVTHDLTHIIQIARVMAKQNKNEVGTFEAYLNVLKS